MSAEELCWLPLERLAPLIQAGEVSPVELTAATLARIERLNPTLNAFMTVLTEAAMAEARAAAAEIQAGRYRGPLHGVPVSVKDLFATRGVRTTAGARILADWEPDYDAAAVERLRAAGVLVYSTCTISPEENERVADRFLAEHHDFRADDLHAAMPVWQHPSVPMYLQTLPHRDATDGFFIVRLRRNA